MLVRVDIPVYRTRLNFRVLKNKKKLLKWSNRFTRENENRVSFYGRAFSVYLDDEGYRALDVIIDKSKLTHGIISHEITHAASFLLDGFLGIPFTEDTEEAYTHLIHYIVECIYIGLRDKGVEVKYADGVDYR